MIESINPYMTGYPDTRLSGYLPTSSQASEQIASILAKISASQSGEQKIKEEFLTIFYKQLLTQAFAPKLFGEEEKGVFQTFGSDMFVEKLALELAKNKSFSLEQLFPSANEMIE